MRKAKGKINWIKVLALLLTIIEIVIAITIDKNYIKGDLNTWRIYTICIIMIPVNIMIILSKRS